MRQRTFAASWKRELGALRKQSKIEFAARVEAVDRWSKWTIRRRQAGLKMA